MMYTAICGSKDLPRTDIKVFTEYSRFTDPRLNAKIYKIMPHLFMDCEYSVWMDGNMYPLKTESEYIKLLNGKDIAVLKHPERTSWLEEAEFCKLKGKDTADRIDPQIARYKAQNCPLRLFSCGFIIRRHTPEMKRLCEQWWAEICAGSVRDQISFPYVFRDVQEIDACCWNTDLFIMKPHIK